MKNEYLSNHLNIVIILDVIDMRLKNVTPSVKSKIPSVQ